MVFEHEVIDGILRINVLNSPWGVTLEDSDVVMANVIDRILEIKRVERVILAETREYEYDFEQTSMLVEVANVYNKLVNEDRILSISRIAAKGCDRFAPTWFAQVQSLVLDMIKRDPIGAYVRVRRMIRNLKTKIEKAPDAYARRCYKHYLENALLPIKNALEKTRIIQIVADRLEGHKIGDRSLYREIFHPLIRPNFMLTRFMTTPPKSGRPVGRYTIGNGEIQVEIFKIPGKVRYFYFISPPEFRLPEEKYAILDAARRYMAEHKPTRTEFVQPEKARETFMNIGRDMIRELASAHNVRLSEAEIEQLAKILTRYTAGFGILEVLLADEKIQDVYINSPIGLTPIYIHHADFEECETNLIPTREDAEAWATRFRMLSGRPLDEANPVLDTELIIPGARARVCAITRTLSPDGLGYAFRRHRDKPWTLPLFINVKFFDPLYAGLMSFLIDGSRSLLIAGTRSSGKTSLLGGLMLEIMKKFRIVTVEDTLELPVVQLRQLGYNIERLKSRSVITRVEAELPAEEALRTALRLGDSCLIIGEVRSSLRGDQEVLILHDNMLKRLPIAEVEKLKHENLFVPTLGKDYKVRLEKLHHFVKHPPRKLFVEITTKTGRKVTVTPEHSVFTVKDFKVVETKASELRVGDKIVIPSKLPVDFYNIDYLNLLEILDDFRLEGVEKYVKEAIKKVGWKKACKLLNVSDVYMYLRPSGKKCRIPVKKFKKLMKEAGVKFNLKNVKIKKVTSKELPALLPVNEDFCRFLGYYVSKGWCGRDKIVISNSDKVVVEDIRRIAEKLFNAKPKVRKTKGREESYQVTIGHTPLKVLLQRLGCGRSSKEKRVPPLIYGLSERKVYAFLEGLYRSDGSLTVSSSSGNTLRYSTKSIGLANDLMYLLLSLGIVAVFHKRYNERYENWLYEVVIKNRKDLKKLLKHVNLLTNRVLIEKQFSHSTLNVIEFSPEVLAQHVRLKREYMHLRRLGRCSKYYLQRLVEDCESSDEIKKFANGDFFVDEVKEVRFVVTRKPEFVYDLSVNPTENFIGGFGGILLHNTEALALFEAMRIGGLANVVAGTIHGESAFGVYDRVVHDLGVPPTSFKAIDLITICNMLRSPDGLHRFRRVVELTEVRKHWKEDPLEEGAFVNLMEYSAKEDRLKPTETLLNGESYVINEIMKRVREWHDNWDAVWDNIMLRAKIKETMVNYAKKLNRFDILEADWTVSSNEMFHMISDEVREEVGSLDSKMIYERWLSWFKSRLKGKEKF